MRAKKRAAESGLEEILGNYLPLARQYFYDTFIGKHAALLKQIAEHCGIGTNWAYRDLPKALIPKHEEFLLALAERCEAETGYVYHTLPKDLIPEHEEFLLKLAGHCGKFWTGGAYTFLPRDLVSNHSDILLDIAKRCTSLTCLVYKFLPREPITAQRDLSLLLELAELSISNRTSWDMKNITSLTAEQYERLLLARKERGIAYFERYLGEHFPIWMSAFDLPTKASRIKTLAVIVHNKNDAGGAFTNENYLNQLLHVLDHYAVYVCETDNRADAFRHIERAALAGEKPRKISLLVLGGHGTPYSLNLGETDDSEYADDERKQLEREQERYFSIFDGARFAEMGRYIAPRGKIVLVSCSTGRDIPNKKNLAQVIADAIPHATVYAPQTQTHVHKFVFKRGRLTDVIYNCGPEQTVKLCSGSHVSTE